LQPAATVSARRPKSGRSKRSHRDELLIRLVIGIAI
jgi:hypothetical protein